MSDAVLHVSAPLLRATRHAELRRGWPTLVACTLGVGTGLSPLPTFSLGLFAVALQAEFGWSRGAILLQPALGTLCILLLGPVIGWLADRHGARPVITAATLLFSLSVASFALIGRPLWTFYLASIALGLTGVGTLPITYAKIVNSWFDAARGLALGIALCATGLAGILIPIYVQTLIAAFGWRWAYGGLALLPLLIGLPAAVLLLKGDRPGPPAASARADWEPPAFEGVSAKAAFANHRFWLMAFSAAAAGAAINGMVANIVPLMVDHGFAPEQAARLFGAMGVAVITGRIAGGWCLDRIWAPAVAAGVFLLPSGGALLLIDPVIAPPTILLAVTMIGLAGGAEFDIVAYLTGRYFGRRNFATLYSVQYAAFAIGAGTAPAIFGRMRDLDGDYARALATAAGLMLAAAAALLALGRYPTRAALANGGTP